MNPKNSPPNTDALLEALERDEEYDGHARAGDVGRPAYFLKELDLPAPGAGFSGGSGPGRRGGGSAALMTDSSPAVQSGQEPSPDDDASPINCANCGAENLRSNKFCGGCGHNLHAEAPAAPSESLPRIPAQIRATLVSINEDGTDGTRVQLEFTEMIIGRAGDVRFPTDAFLSPRHARISIEGARLFIEDVHSLNGTFVKLREEVKLSPGDTFLMGRQVLRFERFEQSIQAKARAADGTRYMGSPPPGGQYKLLQIGIGGIIQNVYCLAETGAIIGREKGDVIFPRDKFMSSRHAQIFARDDGTFHLVDMNSSNGSWIKIWDRRALNPGDFIFLGQQLFRLEVG